MNHNPARQTETASEELSWLAFRFIAGEMSVEESASFEARLADEQRAREAVAEAVELFHAVCAAEAAEPVLSVAATLSPRCERTRWSQRIAWIASGAVSAAVLLVVGLNVANWAAALRPASEPAVASVSPALADAWSSVRTEFAADDAVSVSRTSAIPSELDDDNLDEEVAAFAQEQLSLVTETPSWMTAGVLGLSGRDLPALDSGESQPQDN